MARTEAHVISAGKWRAGAKAACSKALCLAMWSPPRKCGLTQLCGEESECLEDFGRP